MLSCLLLFNILDILVYQEFTSDIQWHFISITEKRINSRKNIYFIYENNSTIYVPIVQLIDACPKISYGQH